MKYEGAFSLRISSPRQRSKSKKKFKSLSKIKLISNLNLKIKFVYESNLNLLLKNRATSLRYLKIEKTKPCCTIKVIKRKKAKQAHFKFKSLLKLNITNYRNELHCEYKIKLKKELKGGVQNKLFIRYISNLNLEVKSKSRCIGPRELIKTPPKNLIKKYFDFEEHKRVRRPRKLKVIRMIR